MLAMWMTETSVLGCEPTTLSSYYIFINAFSAFWGSMMFKNNFCNMQVNDSVHITWEPPAAPSGRILEYSMYMAVRKSRSTSAEGPGQMGFIRIYRGTKMSCTISSSQLDNAHIDSSASNRPAVVLRIAAKNEQGYGPATQIRWIQGGVTPLCSLSCLVAFFFHRQKLTTDFLFA